jgi:type II secretory pathway component GspD/PulD (secretin)
MKIGVRFQFLRFQFLAVGLTIAALAAAQSIEVLSLRYRTAEDVLPLLRPFVEPGGAITGQGNQLFVRVSPANRKQLEQMLAQLDRAPRQLVISVRQDRAGESSERSAGADGSVTITTRAITGSGTLTARDDRTIGTRNAEQTIRVLEGGRASIAMGTAVPFTFRRWLPQPGGAWVATDQTVFYEAITGFQVRPQLAGDVVTLEIAPEDATLRGGTIDNARLATQVQVRLGEWVSLGGADTRAESSQRGLLSAGRDAQSTQRGVWVKVEEVK